MSDSLLIFLADGVALLHAIVLAIYIFGALAVLRGRFLQPLRLWQWFYFAIVSAICLSVICFRVCPLTWAENSLRGLAGSTEYAGKSFVENYFPFVPLVLDQILSLILLGIGCLGVVQACFRAGTADTIHIVDFD